MIAQTLKITLHNQQLNDFVLDHFKTEDLGLNGCMGNALRLFALKSVTDYDDYLNTIDILLDRISDEVILLKDMGFYTGIAGIGWGVEMIAQQGLMQIDTNEVLEELDDQIYRYVFSERPAALSIKNGLLGYFLYFLARKHAIGNLHHYKAIVNEECFSFIIDEMERLLHGENSLFKKTRQTSTDLITIAHYLYFFSDFYEERVNQEASEKILYATVGFTEQYLAQQASISDEDTPYRTFLALSYYIAGVKHKHEYWKKRAKTFLNQLPFPSKNPDSKIARLNALLYHIYIDKRFKFSIANHPSDLASISDAVIAQIAMSKDPLAKLYERYMLVTI